MTSIVPRCSAKSPPAIRYWKRRWSGSLVSSVSGRLTPLPERDRAGVAVDRAGDDARGTRGAAARAGRRRPTPRSAGTSITRSRRTEPRISALAAEEPVDRQRHHPGGRRLAQPLVLAQQVPGLPGAGDVEGGQHRVVLVGAARGAELRAEHVDHLAAQHGPDPPELGGDLRLPRRDRAGELADRAHGVEQARPVGHEAVDPLAEGLAGPGRHLEQRREVLLLAGHGGADERVDVVEVAEQRAGGDAGPLGDLVRARRRGCPRGTGSRSACTTASRLRSRRRRRPSTGSSTGSSPAPYLLTVTC